MKITNRLFDAFIRCKFKLHLLATGHEGVTPEYGILLEDLDREYRERAISGLRQQFDANQVISNPASVVDAQTVGPECMLYVALATDQVAVDSIVLKKISNDGCFGKPEYAPVLLFHREKVNRWDKLLISFHALVLADVLGDLPAFGTIIHGRRGQTSKVTFKTPEGVTAVIADGRRLVNEIRKQLQAKAPALALNDHCPVCEFKDRCEAVARASDDISLLRSLSAGEIETFRERGVFSVQQLSYTFRAKSVTGKRASRAVRHLPALQALSIRELAIVNKEKAGGSPK